MARQTAQKQDRARRPDRPAGAEGLCVETRSRAILADLVHEAVSEAIGLTTVSPGRPAGKDVRTKAAAKDSLK